MNGSIVTFSNNYGFFATPSTTSYLSSVSLFGYSGFLSGIPVNNQNTVYAGITTGSGMFWQVPAGGKLDINLLPGSFLNTGDNLTGLSFFNTSNSDSVYVVSYLQK